MPIDRRTFIEHTLLTTAASVAWPVVAAEAGPVRRQAGPNEVIRVGVIGVRGRGRGHIGAFKKSPDAEVVAICDPDSGVIGPALESVPNAVYYRDLRQMLDDPSIDVVSIATPNHWHALATIWALDAGKHVYVEKPLSHNLSEGRAIIRAATRAGRLVQHGTQARSHVATREAMAFLHEGGLGRVSWAHGLCYKRRESIGKVTAAQTPPATLDYDLWTGPASLGPLMRENLHYDWHWVFDTGNGDIGNQGVHQMDIARWGLGVDTMPARVVSVGGRVGYDDDGNTPNSQLALYDYGDKQLVFEVRGLVTSGQRSAHIGVIFHGEAGYMVSSSYAKVVVFDHDGNVMRTFTGGGDPFQNFLDAIKSGRAADLDAPPLEGHRSCSLCHLGNLSYQLGRTQPLAACVNPFGESASANEAFDGLRRHLIDNGLDPATTPWTVGPVLTIDDASERIGGPHAEAANQRLSRPGRGAFRIPADLL